MTECSYYTELHTYVGLFELDQVLFIQNSSSCGTRRTSASKSSGFILTITSTKLLFISKTTRGIVLLK